MAEGWSTSVLCRYYLNGCCREGSNCRFSHDRQHQPSNVCRYYQKGNCVYGEHCRFDHIKATTMAAASNTSSNSSPGNIARGQPPNGPTPPKIPSPPCTAIQHSLPGTSPESKMTVLKRQQVKSSDSGFGEDTSRSSPPTEQPKLSEWAEAPEFIPAMNLPTATSRSYAQALSPEVKDSDSEDAVSAKTDDVLCPYYVMGECRFGDQCLYIHGDICELCNQPCLHPTDEKQRRLHIGDCTKEHEQSMELAFAVARSKDKICTICMDVIMEKYPLQERRFGILPNCNHIFCLGCIRTWRNTKQLENKTIRSCPQCRTPSDFVTPSKFWVESKEDKEKLIESYKKALSIKPCKYFKQGNGECPFAGNCFYLHAYPDGQKANLPPPRPRRRRNMDGDIELMQQIFLWDFMDEREGRWLFHFDLEDMLDFFSDSDDSLEDYSDFDI